MTELKRFQFKGCRGIYRFRGRALLADEMGLGKTIQALYWLRKIPKHRPAIIVCPASLKWTWQAEAGMHFSLRTEVLEGNRPKRLMRLPGQVVILNYDILKSWLPCLLRSDPQCIIFDEVHYLKSPGAQRTKAAVQLVQNAASVIGLSGTPLTNRPIELWSVLNIIRPEIFPDRGVYAWRFCKPRHTRWGWKYDGATNLGQLHRILHKRVMIRRLKKDVLKELPEKIRHVVSFKLRRKQQLEYNRAQDEFITWLTEINPARAAKAKKSPALTKVGYLLRFVAQMKLEWTKRWIEEFFECNPGCKLVALTMHTFVIEHLQHKFPHCVIVDGSVTGRKRTEAVRVFQTNPKVQLLLGNWRAAGLGLTMTAAFNAVGLDLPWTPGDLLQGEDRIHRIGQKKDVAIHYLVMLGTIEEKLMKILQKKATVLDAVLNGTISSADLNIFEALLTEMKEMV